VSADRLRVVPERRAPAHGGGNDHGHGGDNKAPGPKKCGNEAGNGQHCRHCAEATAAPLRAVLRHGWSILPDDPAQLAADRVPSRDLTADVDFGALTRAAAKVGLRVERVVDQPSWLRGHGWELEPAERRGEEDWALAGLLDERLPFVVWIAQR
jgi:hypothetical protein